MDKKSIYVNFIDFYSDFRPTHIRIFSLLKNYYDVQISDSPQFIFYSCFSQEHLKYNNIIKIFFTSENVRPDFNVCDYAIAFDRINFGDRYHRNSMAVKKSIPLVSGLEKRKFCNFVYSNKQSGEGTKIRQDFCLNLAKYKHVDCPGRVLNNMKNAISPREGNFINGKMDFIKNYKFTIAFENSSSPGYITEKLKQPLLANSIPIYWGAPDVSLDFNPKAFINCHDFANFDEVIEYVKYLDNNDEAYLEMLSQPPMRPDFDYENDKLDNFLINIIENGSIQAKDPRNLWSPASHYNASLNKLKRNLIEPIVLAACPDKKEILDNISFASINSANFASIASQISSNFYSEDTIARFLSISSPNADCARQRALVLKSANARISKGIGRLNFCQDKQLEHDYREILRLLWPHDLEGRDKVRVGGNRDGGYVMPDPGKDGIAYSFGIGSYAPWDEQMTYRGYKVFQFDATIEHAPFSNQNVFFFRKNITGRKKHGENEMCIEEIFAKLGHESMNDIILQIDVEGMEWEFFENITDELILKFSQIIAEFHGLTNKNNLAGYRKIFEKILHTHIPVHFHYNNNGNIFCFEDFMVSSLFEISFARKNLGVFKPSEDSFPMSLDFPNISNIPEVHIGKFSIISHSHSE